MSARSLRSLEDWREFSRLWEFLPPHRRWMFLKAASVFIWTASVKKRYPSLEQPLELVNGLTRAIIAL